MNILEIGIAVFIFIETLNIIILYFKPTFKYGNGIGVFNAYEKSKSDQEIHNFITYLINWVAGTKLIFIMIGIVVIFFGNYDTQLFTVVALIISILSFYWRLFPMIRKLDKNNQITPKGYSKTLNIMILFFVLGFLAIFIVTLLVS